MPPVLKLQALGDTGKGLLGDSRSRGAPRELMLGKSGKSNHLPEAQSRVASKWCVRVIIARVVPENHGYPQYPRQDEHFLSILDLATSQPMTRPGALRRSPANQTLDGRPGDCGRTLKSRCLSRCQETAVVPTIGVAAQGATLGRFVPWKHPNLQLIHL